MEKSKNKLRLHRKKRIRMKIKGTAEIPRLAVFRSLRNISAQIINDEEGRTLFFSSLKEVKGKNSLEGAALVGQAIAKKCLKKKISKVVFDRSGYKYHGKVKAVAEGARKEGLKI